MLRRALHRIVPTNFHDPFGLAGRLLRTRDPAALSAMKYAALCAIATPLDMALAPWERRRYSRAVAPERPLIFVCGPPRSGTTIVALTLLRELPLAHISNLTSIFPRAPLTATRLFGPRFGRAPIGDASFYGRVAGLSSPNDGLHLWDRWLGADRTRVPRQLTHEAAEGMQRFFGALEEAARRPVLNKCNYLNLVANLVAEVLPTSRFICLTRNPLDLAQSLYQARLTIHGNPRIPYGHTSSASLEEAPVASVCRQVRYHKQLQERQQHQIGADRFRVLRYEDFCQNPNEIVRAVAEMVDVASPSTDVERLAISTGCRVDREVYDRLRHTLRLL